MKSSQILASVLFGSIAAAFPFKRDLITKTQVQIETVIVYTTVWEDDVPVAEATATAGGYFYEQSASSAAETTPAATSTPAYTPSAVQEPTSVYTPPVQTPAPSSTVVVVSSAAPAPKPVETSSAPAPAAPTTTEAAYTPAPVSSAAPTTTTEAAYTPAPVSSAAPATTTAAAAAAAPATQQQSSYGSTSTGENFSSVDLTINPLNGALGACGEPMQATDFYVALAAPAWGASTYDSQTGKATNKWCGQKIKIEYNGKSVDATIMDMCPGCSGHDLDLSDAAWAAIGMTEWTRVQGSWSMVN